jgi:hypothetical protein
MANPPHSGRTRYKCCATRSRIGKEIIVQLDNHFMRHPCEPRPTVEKDELDKLLNNERPALV